MENGEIYIRCVEVYYVAEGVRIFSQETWRQIAGTEGKELVQKYIQNVVSGLLYAVREAACACIAELGSKIRLEAVRPYVDRLLSTILTCFNDDSWPVRDAACVACGNFIACFPEESRGSMPSLYPLFFRNLGDAIPSVRQGGAAALGSCAKVYGKEAAFMMLGRAIEGLNDLQNQPSDTEKYNSDPSDKETGRTSPLPFGVAAKRLRDNDLDLHSNQQMYSCGSLAPKMGRGCDQKFRRPPQPWEMADGCVHLIAELSQIPWVVNATSENSEINIITAINAISAACNLKHYAYHLAFHETVCKQLPVIARGLGKKGFKAVVADFFDAIFYSLNCEQDPKENHSGDGNGKQTIPPPLVPIDRLGKTSPTHGHSPAGPPRLQRFPQRDAQFDQRGISNSSSHVTGVNVFARHRPPMFIRGVVGNSGSNRSNFSSNFPDSLTRETSLGQSVAIMQGRKYVVVPKNVLSVLPGAANAAAAAAAAFSGGNLSRGSVIPISREWLCSLPRTKQSVVRATGGTFIPPSLIQPTSAQPRAPVNASSTQPVNLSHEMKPQYVIISSPVQGGMPSRNGETSAASSGSVTTPFSTDMDDERTTYKSDDENEIPRKRKMGLLPSDQPASKRAKKTESNGFMPSKVENGEITGEDECSDEGSDETPKTQRDMFSEDFMNNLSSGYSALLHVFHYLNVQDLLRAAMVCRLWRDLAGGHHSLWRTVRMKNSQVVDWTGFADTLARNRTEILDLRKMLLPASGPPQSQASNTGSSEDGGVTKNKDKRSHWGQDFCHAISRASASLRRLELCRCGMDVLEGVASSCPLLTALCAQAIRAHELDLKFAGELIHLQELRIKSPSGMSLVGDLAPIERLTSLKHLSITTVRDLSGDNGERLSVLGALVNLESLELGECSAFGEAACKAIENLQGLSRLRLEKGEVGQKAGVAKSTSSEGDVPAEELAPSWDLLSTLSRLTNLVQLELVNFDIGMGFDDGLEKCISLHRLLIIPNYVAQSAVSNKLIMSGAMKLSKSLNTFTWGVTHEVLQALELFVASDGGASEKKEVSSSEDDHEEEASKRSSNKGKNLPSSECLPILKPLPSVTEEEKEMPKEETEEESEQEDKFSRVEFVPLSKLHGLLSAAMPNTKVQIVKMPFSATWRQGISEVDL